MGFEEMWATLAPIGRDEATGGYHRFAWTPAELACRTWFLGEAARRDLEVEQDRNGNLFAWWYPDHSPPAQSPPVHGVRPTPGAGRDDRVTEGVLTGSHLDSVPGGGAYDGPLGVVGALAAIDLLRAGGLRPVRPIGVAVFVEEEGARFGVACLGSRLLTGAIDPGRARELRDSGGVSLGEAMARDDGGWAAGSTLAASGLDPAAIGADEELLGRIGCFVELHVEQGRLMDAPVAVASTIWPHGRWRLEFSGRGDHAGTTRLDDRRDPLLPFAHTVLAARAAARHQDGLATIGRVAVIPGGVNVIASRVTAWLDARAPDDRSVRRTVEEIIHVAQETAGDHGVTVAAHEESYTSVVTFEGALRERLARILQRAGFSGPVGTPAQVLPTGAGHDAGVLAARLPTAMLFVRNPTGVSHAPQEHADPADCLVGVEALAAVLADLACEVAPGHAGLTRRYG